eukprot:scaffold43861_cov21-Tisochrysis_lutea.AAC.2
MAKSRTHMPSGFPGLPAAWPQVMRPFAHQILEMLRLRQAQVWALSCFHGHILVHVHDLMTVPSACLPCSSFTLHAWPCPWPQPTVHGLSTSVMASTCSPFPEHTHIYTHTHTHFTGGGLRDQLGNILGSDSSSFTGQNQVNLLQQIGNILDRDSPQEGIKDTDDSLSASSASNNGPEKPSAMPNLEALQKQADVPKDAPVRKVSLRWYGVILLAMCYFKFALSRALNPLRQWFTRVSGATPPGVQGAPCYRPANSTWTVEVLTRPGQLACTNDNTCSDSETAWLLPPVCAGLPVSAASGCAGCAGLPVQGVSFMPSNVYEGPKEGKSEANSEYWDVEAGANANGGKGDLGPAGSFIGGLCQSSVTACCKTRASRSTLVTCTVCPEASFAAAAAAAATAASPAGIAKVLQAQEQHEQRHVQPAGCIVSPKC